MPSLKRDRRRTLLLRVFAISVLAIFLAVLVLVGMPAAYGVAP